MKIKKSLIFKIGLITLFTVTALLLWRYGISSSAVFDSDTAVNINPDEIENSTLIIGTHLIYIHSLNDEIYNIALDSASASGQENIYYKSELADGTWFDITDATSIADISTSGVIASNDEIAELSMTHHTKSDGITYDLRTNQSVCIFDIYDVYDLENMEELEAVKMQYDMMKESNSSDKTAKRNLNYVKNFFASTVTNDTTNICDERLNALQGYYEELVTNDAPSSETEMVLHVMSKVDYERRAAVYSLVDDYLSNLQDLVADTQDDEDEDSISMDDALITAIGNSQSAIGESLAEAEGNMLVNGDTVLSQKEYELSYNLIDFAMSQNYASCDTYNYKLQYLDNINNGRIVDRTNELALLDELITSSDASYSDKLKSVPSSEYTVLVNRNASNAALQSQIKSDMVDVNAIRSELQFLIQSKTDRLESEEAQTYVLDRIENVSSFRILIQNDDYKTSLSDTVDQYVEWLNSLLKTIKSEGTSQSESDSLYEQKANLQEMKMEALDSLDLDTAKRIDAQISELDSQIDQLENSASQNLAALLSQKAQLEEELESNSNDILLQNQLAQIEASIADNSTDINSESIASNIMDAKSKIMDAIAEGNTTEATLDMINNNVDLLTTAVDSGSALALEALKEVYNKMLAKSELDSVSNYDDMIDVIEQSVAESSVNSSLSGELSVSDATQTLADSLGVDSLLDDDGNISGDVSDSDLAAVLIALGDFNKKTNDSEEQTSSVQAFTDGILAGLDQSGDSIVFQSYSQGSEEYIPAKTLAEYAGYRYVWNDTKKQAILSRGRTYYSFTAFKETVENEKGDDIYMDVTAAFSGDVYIPSSFATDTFGCYVYDISGTNYAVLVNDKVVEKSQQLLSELLEKGGYY